MVIVALIRRRAGTAWSRALEGTVDDPGTIDVVNATLRRIENELIARRRGADGQHTHNR